MKNLCITLHIKTPIIPGKYPLNLDGLLYWSAYEGSNEDSQRAIDILNLALASDQGVYKSSDMSYVHTPQHGLTQQEAAFSTNFNWREHKHPIGKTSIMEGGGPYRARLTKYISIGTQAVRFYAVGDEDLIRFLIDSAGFVGRGNNQGHGEISEIVIEEIEQDYSWFRVTEDKSVVLERCLPANVADNIDDLKPYLKNQNLLLVRTAPPYTSSKEHEGYSTSFKREVVVSL